MRVRRIPSLLLVVSFLVAFLAGEALASKTSWTKFSGSTTGASFSGSWISHTKKSMGGDGGWERKGTLTDTNCGDGNNVFDEAHIDGYGWSQRFYGVQCGNKYLDNTFLPGAGDLMYTHAYWHVCRDRGILYPDNCSAIKTFTWP